MRQTAETLGGKLTAQQWLLFYVAILCAVLAVQVYVVNDTDTSVLREGVLTGLSGGNPLGQNAFWSPPHAVVWLAPFVLLGEKVTAAFNVFFVSLLMARIDRPPIRWVNLLIVFHPALLFAIGTANVVGITTSIGLLLVLMRQKGVLRALAWTYLAIRPQDAILVLLIDGVLALRERDWRAIGWALLFVSPSIIFGYLWLGSIPLGDGGPLDYTLSPRIEWGILPAILILSVALFPMLTLWKPPQQVLTEHWVLVAVLVQQLLVSNYVTVYMVWLVMLTIREMSWQRSLAHYVVTFGILMQTMAELRDANLQRGYVAVVWASTWLLIQPSMLPYWRNQWKSRNDQTCIRKGLIDDSSPRN